VVRIQFYRKRKRIYAGVLLHKGDEIPDELVLIKGARGGRGGAEAREGGQTDWRGVNTGWRKSPWFLLLHVVGGYLFQGTAANQLFFRFWW